MPMQQGNPGFQQVYQGGFTNNQGYGNVPQNTQGPLQGADNLFAEQKVAILPDNTCVEKILQCLFPYCDTCGCPFKRKVVATQNGYETSDRILFTITHTKCCCPNEWTLRNDQGVDVSKYSERCCFLHPFTLCFGGPGYDVKDMGGQTLGDASYPPCQCCDGGWDINQEGTRRWFVGNVCSCCERGIYPIPVWDGQQQEIVRVNVHVTPCLKRYLPWFCCCMHSYNVLWMPDGSGQVERAAMIAGGMMHTKN